MSHVPVSSFEDLYRVDPDPWQFATSRYEQRRYDITVACLPRARYAAAFEPGCAIGELTRRLAGRCDRVGRARRRADRGGRGTAAVPVARARRGAAGRAAGRLAVGALRPRRAERDRLLLRARRAGRAPGPGGRVARARGHADRRPLAGSERGPRPVRRHRPRVPRATAASWTTSATTRRTRSCSTSGPGRDPLVRGGRDPGPRRGGSPLRLPGVGAAGRRPRRAAEGDRVEVVVVADACRDSTAAVAEAVVRGWGEVLAVEIGSAGGARAAGVRAYLARHDRPSSRRGWRAPTPTRSSPTTWIDHQLGLARLGVAGVAGIVAVDSFTDHPAHVPARWAGLYDGPLDDPHPHIHGANLGLRADAYLAVGGWAALEQGEDRQLWAALQDAGYPVASPRSLVVTTSGRAQQPRPRGLRRLPERARGGVVTARPLDPAQRQVEARLRDLAENGQLRSAPARWRRDQGALRGAVALRCRGPLGRAAGRGAHRRRGHQGRGRPRPRPRPAARGLGVGRPVQPGRRRARGRRLAAARAGAAGARARRCSTRPC